MGKYFAANGRSRLTPSPASLFASALALSGGIFFIPTTPVIAAPKPVKTEADPQPAKPKPPGANDVYAPPSAAELKAEVLAWAEQHQAQQPQLVETIGPSWQFDEKPSPEQLFETLMRTFYLADRQTRELVDACRNWSYSPAILQVSLPSPERDAQESLLTHNVRYFLARHLTLLNAYNEALAIFEQIDLNHVVDPAGCLFHRAVCEQHLLLKEQGLKTLQALRNQTEGVPVRYRKLAELMQADLEKVQEKTLGEVARQMKDVERRLSLNQTGSGVQQVENKIIATLDELIKQMEDQQQQSSSSSGGGASQGQPPSSPMGEAQSGGVMPVGSTGPSDRAGKDNWGGLPPKEKEAAKNMLESEFPAHYRAAVEEYLKKLAERPAPSR